MGTPDDSEIRVQVEDICKSKVLDGAPRRRELLRYIVEATLAGEPATETSIATEVYGKSTETFNPAIDTIARVETGKLRQRLKAFYETEGKDAPVEITVVKYAAVARYTGSYVPVPSSEAPATVFELQRLEVQMLLYSSELRVPNEFLAHLDWAPHYVRFGQGPRSTIPSKLFLIHDAPGALQIYDADVVNYIVSFQRAAESGDLDEDRMGLYHPDFDANAKGARRPHLYHDVDTSFFLLTREEKLVLALESAQRLFLRKEGKAGRAYPFLRLMTEDRWTAMQQK